MEQPCLQCKKLYEAKKEGSKFCSAKCRVKWHYHNPSKDKKVPKFEAMGILNEAKATLQKVQELLQNKSAPIFNNGVSLARNDENLATTNTQLGSWLDMERPDSKPVKKAQIDEFFEKLELAETSYECNQLATACKKTQGIDWADKTRFIKTAEKKAQTLGY